jgi:outer membrane protein assembly factor BamB
MNPATRTILQSTLAFTLGFQLAVAAQAQEWTRFRGPNGSGLSNAKTIPTRWTEADFNWKAALPGVGHGSPVLWGDRVFVTASDEKRGVFMVLCLRAGDGSVLWQQEFPVQPLAGHRYNSFASSSPAVDADRVYVCRTEAAQQVLMALNHQGAKVWERDFGRFAAQHGSGTSPIVHDGLVVLANEQDGESFLVAVNAATGKTRWQTPRQTKQAAYSTPCVLQAAGAPPLLLFNSEAHGISALAPDTGNVVWEFPKAFDKRSVSSPVIADGLVIGSCGSGGGGNYVVAVRPGDASGAKPPQRAYEIRRSAPYVPTSLCVDGRLFLWSDAGIVSCVVASTGEAKWQERVGGDFFGSPVCVDGRLFCVSTAGDVVVVRAGERFELLAKNPLGELTHSTPAVAGGSMFIRTRQHLVSVGGKAPAAASPP